MLQALPTALIFSQIVQTLFWMLAWHTGIDLSSFAKKKKKYPLVDKSSLSLPLAQGICVLWTPSKGYKRLALPVGGGVCYICLAKDCDSLPSPEVHVALPPVCTQRKIKLAFPCLWNFMLTDLSGMSLSSLWQLLISQACCVSRLTSYCMCIQTDYKFPTLPRFVQGIISDRWVQWNESTFSLFQAAKWVLTHKGTQRQIFSGVTTLTFILFTLPFAGFHLCSCKTQFHIVPVLQSSAELVTQTRADSFIDTPSQPGLTYLSLHKLYFIDKSSEFQKMRNFHKKSSFHFWKIIQYWETIEKCDWIFNRKGKCVPYMRTFPNSMYLAL